MQAYIFAIPDYFDPNKETLIIKTIVKNNESKLNKIGEYTFYKINKLAQKYGFKKVIHALMSKENVSSEKSNNKESKSHREYALYGFVF